MSNVGLINGRGVSFLAKLKKRNQITVDSTIVEAMGLEKNKMYNFMLVISNEDEENDE